MEDWGRLYLRVVELYKERGQTVPEDFEEVKNYNSKQLLKLINTLEKGDGNDESKS